jgi:hypothetical protein
MMGNLYTTMSWREMKIIQAAMRICSQHNYQIAAGELRNVRSSQSLPLHRERRGEHSTYRGRPVTTVELPSFPKIRRPVPMLLPAPQEIRAIDASRL